MIFNSGKPEIGLGITGATAGDVPVVGSIDANGKPTTWQTSDIQGDIDELNSNLTNYCDRLLNAIPTKTLTNQAIATFSDGADSLPVKAMEVAITPVQDTTYGNPYPAGGSNNLIPDGTDTSNGYVAGEYLNSDGTTGSSSIRYVSEYFAVTAGGTYTLSQNGTASSSSICFYDSEKVFISGVALGGLASQTITAPENAAYCRATQTILTNFSSDGIQLELGSTATAVKPYSNICPISGWTGAEITRRGKNLIDQSTATIYSRWFHPSDKWVYAEDSTCFAFKCKPNTTYTVSASNPDVVVFRVGYIETEIPTSTVFSASPSLYAVSKPDAPGAVTLTTSSDATYIIVQLGSSRIRTSDLQIEFGSTATAYEAYQSVTIPVSWQSEAGTVYGGTLTDNGDGTWMLKPTKAKFHLSENDVTNIVGGGTTACRFVFDIDASQLYASDEENNYITIFDKLPTAYIASTTTDMGGMVFYSTAQRVAVRPPNADSFTTLEDAKNWMTNIGGIDVCAVLYNPSTTYTLTADDVATLLGANNIWADCGNINTLTYRRDGTLALAELEAAIAAL